jgi:hypothetical protein
MLQLIVDVDRFGGMHGSRGKKGAVIFDEGHDLGCVEDRKNIGGSREI